MMENNRVEDGWMDDEIRELRPFNGRSSMR
jgi:hypothetical protein